MNTKIKIFTIAVVVLLIIMVAPAVWLYPTFRDFSQLEKIEVDPQLTLLLGYGSNSGVLVSDTDDKKTLVIDTKIMGGAQALNELVGQKSQGGPIIVVNTHYHSDHTGGNSLYKGETIIAGAYEREVWAQDNKADAEPTEWLKDRKDIQIGTEKVTILNVGQSHTYQDMVVYLHKRATLFTGDLVFNQWHPVLRKESGANTEKWRENLHRLLSEFHVSRVVPGHGPIGDGLLLLQQAAYFTRIENSLFFSDADQRLEMIRKQYYQDLFVLPTISGFEKSVEFIRSENPQISAGTP